VRSTLSRWWYSFATAVADLLDEAAFRVVLAARILAGRVPLETEKRFWNRSLETPVLVDVVSWVDDRRIASVVIWPPLESDKETAAADHYERAQQFKWVLAKGASELAWSTRFETDFGLRWDHARKVWSTSDGFSYDGKRSSDRDAA